MTEIEFVPWPKIARFNRNIIVSEKLDGTNQAIQIVAADPTDSQDGSLAWTKNSGVCYKVVAQSRNRIITPGKSTDNMGFAQWVYDNCVDLVDTLGEGVHFGEWWGRKIARAYNQTDRTFSLFNTSRWTVENTSPVPGLSVVPVLYEGPMYQDAIEDCLDDLREFGSAAAKGFMRPEGVVIFHTAANMMFKITLEKDEYHKGEQ